MHDKFHESLPGGKKGAMNARQVSRKSPWMAKRGYGRTCKCGDSERNGKKGVRLYL